VPAPSPLSGALPWGPGISSARDTPVTDDT
jgi:hypothetical protein